MASLEPVVFTRWNRGGWHRYALLSSREEIIPREKNVSAKLIDNMIDYNIIVSSNENCILQKMNLFLKIFRLSKEYFLSIFLIA